MTILIAVGLLALIILINVLFGKFPCNCGRSRPPYFFKQHNQVWTMVFWAVYWTILTGANLIAAVGGDVLTIMTTVLFSLITMFYWRIVWFHEKDKIKKAAKAAGRVFVNKDGRLKVAHNA